MIVEVKLSERAQETRGKITFITLNATERKTIENYNERLSNEQTARQRRKTNRIRYNATVGCPGCNGESGGRPFSFLSPSQRYLAHFIRSMIVPSLRVVAYRPILYFLLSSGMYQFALFLPFIDLNLLLPLFPFR
uniref:Uncharacterized protein n=1 Tax=Heterorhabditis bacteriophora TaxID=37862 RepID=A0A1I7WJC2_HETBA